MARSGFNWQKVAWEKKIREQGSESAFNHLPRGEAKSESPTKRNALTKKGAREALPDKVSDFEKEELSLLSQLRDVWVHADVPEHVRAFVLVRISLLEKRLGKALGKRKDPESKAPRKNPKTPKTAGPAGAGTGKSRRVQKKKDGHLQKSAGAIGKGIKRAKPVLTNEEAEKLRNDPEYQAKVAAIRKRQEARMERVVVEMKQSRSKAKKSGN